MSRSLFSIRRILFFIIVVLLLLREQVVTFAFRYSYRRSSCKNSAKIFRVVPCMLSSTPPTNDMSFEELKELIANTSKNIDKLSEATSKNIDKLSEATFKNIDKLQEANTKSLAILMKSISELTESTKRYDRYNTNQNSELEYVALSTLKDQLTEDGWKVEDTSTRTIYDIKGNSIMEFDRIIPVKKGIKRVLLMVEIKQVFRKSHWDEYSQKLLSFEQYCKDERERKSIGKQDPKYSKIWRELGYFIPRRSGKRDYIIKGCICSPFIDAEVLQHAQDVKCYYVTLTNDMYKAYLFL